MFAILTIAATLFLWLGLRPSALSADSPMTLEIGQLNDLPAAASAHAYEGSAIGLASGYARPLTAGDPFMGHAYQEADNSDGDAADIYIRVRSGPYRAQVTLTSVAVTDVGKDVYMSDDATYTLTQSTNSYVGKVLRYVTTNTCVVEFYPNKSDAVNHQHTAATDGGPLTSPRVVTAIADTNGAELIKVTATGTAVNEVTVANAATSGEPAISASGGDNNVGLDIVTKGTGLGSLVGDDTDVVQWQKDTDAKIGFLGATPAAQQAHIADASGDDSTTVNAILDVLEAFGLVATS